MVESSEPEKTRFWSAARTTEVTPAVWPRKVFWGSASLEVVRSGERSEDERRQILTVQSSEPVAKERSVGWNEMERTASR